MLCDLIRIFLMKRLRLAMYSRNQVFVIVRDNLINRNRLYNLLENSRSLTKEKIQEKKRVNSPFTISLFSARLMTVTGNF